MDLSRYFEREAGGTTELLGHTSFDNHLAANLLEFGVIGIAVEILLYCRAVSSLVSIGMRHKDRDREFYAAIITSVGIFIYAMTTVYIFSPQLRFLYWSLFANGLLKSNGWKSLQLSKSLKTQAVSVNLRANTSLLGAMGAGSKKVQAGRTKLLHTPHP
jgi:O-antigen ligase